MEVRLPREAWLAVLGGDASALRRRLEWDGLAAGPETEPALSLRVGRPRVHESWPIRQWLIDATPIVADQSPVDPVVAFEDLWRRIADEAIDRLIAEVPGQNVTPLVWGDLRDALVQRIAEVGEAVMWQKFNEGRTPEQIVAVHVDAAERPLPRTAYAAFLEAHRADGLDGLSAEFPLLTRHLETVLRQWSAASIEMLVRLDADRPLLENRFGLPAGAVLHRLTSDLSDRHADGKTVSLLEFRDADATAHRVLYKPRDLRMDVEFHRLLATLPCPLSSDAPLRACVVEDRGGYGYMEWVPHEVCTADEELARFYRNAGRLTAVLHVLGSSDCHHENLIAVGDQLVLIDAETLFEGVQAEGVAVRPTLRRTRLHDQVNSSVARLGLLPEWRYVGARRDTADGSALGIAPPRCATAQVQGWVALNTDGMHAGEVSRTAYLATSLPVGPGNPNPLCDFVEDFCSGFRDQLLSVARSKPLWLGDDGLLARFRTLQRRYVPRPTWLYTWLIRQLTEPVALGSEAAQQLVLETLARRYVTSDIRPAAWPLLTIEMEQVGRLDVPHLWQHVDSRQLSTDGVTVPGFMARTGYEVAHDKITDLDPAAVDLQIQVIRGMVFAKGRLGDSHERVSELPIEDDGVDDPLTEAVGFADQLAATAIFDGDAAEWLGIDVAEDIDRSRYGALGLSLYGGRIGLALFLASIGARRGSSEYARVAVGACADLWAVADDDGSDEIEAWCRRQPLGLAGVGGLLLAVQWLQQVPAITDSVSRARDRIIAALPGLVDHDSQLDIINGVAGLIGPLLAVGSDQAVSLARKAGEVLVHRQDPSGGWRIAAAAAALTGFSHGAAGMAAALAALHTVDGDADCLAAARRALNFERAAYNSERRNWPDWRGGGEPRYAVSWCHGAPGIALARLCLHDSPLWDGDSEAELRTALATTAQAELNGDSLCCGVFGRSAILRLAARHLSEPSWRDAASRLEERSRRRRLTRGAYSFLDIPGLFTGAAGAGLACLDNVAPPDAAVLPGVLSAGLYRETR